MKAQTEVDGQSAEGYGTTRAMIIIIIIILIILNKFIYNPTVLDSHTQLYTSRIKYKAIKCDAT